MCVKQLAGPTLGLRICVHAQRARCRQGHSLVRSASGESRSLGLSVPQRDQHAISWSSIIKWQPVLGCSQKPRLQEHRASRPAARRAQRVAQQCRVLSFLAWVLRPQSVSTDQRCLRSGVRARGQGQHVRPFVWWDLKTDTGRWVVVRAGSGLGAAASLV